MKAARYLACLFLVMIAVNSARVVAQQSKNGESPPPAATDPLTKELQRCKQLNENASSDPACEAAYKEVRRRFFSHSDTYQPAPVDMFPKEHHQPWTTDKKPTSPSTEK
jgi:conjugative transfer region protein TrbK